MGEWCVVIPRYFSTPTTGAVTTPYTLHSWDCWEFFTRVVSGENVKTDTTHRRVQVIFLLISCALVVRSYVELAGPYSSRIVVHRE